MNNKIIAIGLVVLIAISGTALAQTTLWTNTSDVTYGNGIGVDSEDNIVIVADNDNDEIHILDQDTGNLEDSFSLPSHPRSMEYSPELNLLAVSHYDGSDDKLAVYDLDGNLQWDYNPSATDSDIALAENGTKVIWAMNAYGIGYWDMETGTNEWLKQNNNNWDTASYDPIDNEIWAYDQTATTMYIYDPDGNEQHSFSYTGGTNIRAIAAYDGNAYVSDDQDNTYFYEDKTGNRRLVNNVWTITDMEIRETNQYVYAVVVSDDTVKRIGSYGSVDWSESLPFTAQIDSYIAVGISGGNYAIYETSQTQGAVAIGTDDKYTVPSTIDLKLEVDPWMPFNSTQSYTVIQNETFENGTSVTSDVTQDANVTSADTSIIVVNNSTDNLESLGETGRTNVSAAYNGGVSEKQNVTVGNRNLTNIGIMPPEQWIGSFLEIDDTKGGHNIGSSTQWILFIIIIMSAVGKVFDNPWAGIGSGVITAVLIWVMEYIGLGIMLTTLFFAIFVGLILVKVRRDGGNEVTIGNE